MLSPRQVRILVVDSDHAIRDMLVERFTIFGFKTLAAADGEQAWQLVCSDSAIKIVVANLTLDKVSGLELIERCRNVHPEWPRFYFLADSGSSSVEKAFALGADGGLEKPFDARNLLNLVRSSLLTVTEKLRYPPYLVPTETLKLTFPSLEAAHRSGKFALGRGGLTAIMPSGKCPAPGHPIALELALGELELQGFGVVRWLRPSAQGDEVGIELTYLKPEHNKKFSEWLANCQPTAFIPSLQIVASIPSTAKLQSTG